MDNDGGHRPSGETEAAARTFARPGCHHVTTTEKRPLKRTGGLAVWNGALSGRFRSSLSVYCISRDSHTTARTRM